MKFFKPLLAFGLFLCCITFLTGCQESKEINDMAIVTGMTVDWDPDLREYMVVGETASKIPELGAVTGEIRTVEGSGRTVTAALENCKEGEERKIYRSHSKIFILDRNFAEKGIRPLLEHAIRNYDTRLSVDLLLADNTVASDVWSWDTGSSGIKAFDLESLLITGEENSLAPRLRAYQAAELLYAKGLSLTMPLISQDGSGRVRLTGTAVFRDDRMVGQLDETETTWMLFLQDRIQNHVLPLSGNGISAPGEVVTLQVEDSHTTLRPTWKDNNLSMEVRIHIKSGISEASPDVSKDDIIQAAEQTVTAGCTELVKKAQGQFQSDIFGFGRSVNRYYPRLFTSIQEDWNERGFPAMPVTIICTVELTPGEVSY